MAKKYYTESIAKAQKKYNEANTTMVTMKLHNDYDKDILEKLEQVESKQGYIKELIRRDLKAQKVTSLFNKIQ